MSTPLNESMPRPLAFGHGVFMLPHSIWLPILAMCGVALGAFLFNEWSVKRIRSGDDELAALTMMRQDLNELRARLGDAESGQRGFILSRDPRFLETYEDATNALPVIGARLRVHATEDPELLASVQKLESLRGQSTASMRALVMLVEQGRRDDAMAIIRTGEGFGSAAAFRSEAEKFAADLQRRVTELRARTSEHVQWSRVAVASLGVLTLALLVLALRLLGNDFERQDSARLEQATERQRLEQVVEERTAELSDLTTHLQTVTEQEKAELARDLHDELGGLLTAARMDLAWLQGRASDREPAVRAKLDGLAGALEEAMSLKRRVVENLRPALLDHFGLPTALQAYFEETCRIAGLRCDVQIPADSGQVPQDLAIALFRVGQESLTNIMRHARATGVELKFSVDVQRYFISIADDGAGFDPASLGGAVSHGLGGMRHRIRNLGGQFVIRANVPHGTRIEVTVPRSPLA